MKIYRGFEDRGLRPKKRSIAIGVFDGMHLAHQRILKNAVRGAKKERASSAVVTFDPHPQKILSGKVEDPARGATHYYNPGAVKKPYWTSKMKKIGRIKVSQTELSKHEFYREV